ncbi:MAG: cofactor-independent phosphoglycerate mutase [Peptococcaceae bacterium]|nr:cofactor-independent phosphoglycerate mutase [Peptococcaceae bacterium]
MKYLVLLGDGMADYKRPELGGLTPLQYAKTPNMDRLAAAGTMGLARTVPDGLPPGSDVANLSVLGYDPAACYTGRAPLEAVSMGVKLGEHDVAFRCNLVTLSDGGEYEDKTMVDYSAGEISSERAAVLINDLGCYLNKENMRFYPGVSYRHLMVWSGGPAGTVLTPPHDISGQKIAGYLPRGGGGDELLALMKESHQFLKSHRLNLSGRGDRPANSVWLWGQGKSPALRKFKDRYNLSGAVISAVDLIKGIGLCAGMEVVKVEGATGNIHTNFAGKAAAALEAFDRGADLVYLHVEAPDEAGHQGNTETKVRAIEEIDEKVLGPLLAQLGRFGDFKVMVLPDHPTPVSLMTHTAEPVPFVIFDSRSTRVGAGGAYCEETAARGVYVERGHELMDIFLERIKPS